MKILITGGAGFIGSTLTDSLMQDGHTICCADNFDPFYAVEIKKKNIAGALSSSLFTLHETDIRSGEEIKKILQSNRFDLIIHLAARPGVRHSIEEPERCFDINYNGTASLLQAMEETGHTCLIFSSSSSVYGNTEGPTNERSTCCPLSPYAESKLKCEELITGAALRLNMKVLIFRLFSVYGERQRPDLAINKFYRQIKAGCPVELYGDGKSARDYTYVRDVVRCFKRGLLFIQKRANPFTEIINIGRSNPVTLDELLIFLEKRTGSSFKRLYNASHAGEVTLTWADNQKCKHLLGYTPGVNLQEWIMKSAY